MGMCGEGDAPAALPPGRRLSTHFTGDWVGPSAGLYLCENLAPPEFDPRNVQTVWSRHTDWTILAHPFIKIICYNYTAESPSAVDKILFRDLTFIGDEYENYCVLG